jgi:hypothetical protein
MTKRIEESAMFPEGTEQSLRSLNELIRIVSKTEIAMRAYQLPVEEPCPVSERVLGDLYRANPEGLATLVQTIPATSRALLALYCFKRVHLKSIALALADTCNKDDLIVHGGDFGADLYERARRAPQVIEQRPKISLSRGALMKVVVDQDLI